MKHTILLALLFLAPGLFAGEFNVKKFGAVGDGRADDTKAIQAAFNAAAQKARTANRYGKHPRSSYFGSMPEVTFPHGVYKITKTINVRMFVSLSGVSGSSIIRWHGAENETMFKITAFRTAVEKLIFAGGAVQLHFSNRNLDKTLINIRDCQFLYASDIAVKLEPVKGISHLSALTSIERCLFSKNYRCVQNFGDLMDIRNVWVDQTQPQMADGAAFINRYGTMRIAFSCLTPSANPEKGPDYYHNARWVDNYNRFEADSVRFGGEGGGIPICYNFAKAATKHPATDGGRIAIYNSLIACGQQRRENGAVIRLFRLPSQITIRDCYGIGVTPLIVLDPALNIAEEKKKNPNGLRNARYHISNTLFYNRKINAIPVELKPFFTSDSDCSFEKILPRPIPRKITDTRKKK